MTIGGLFGREDSELSSSCPLSMSAIKAIRTPSPETVTNFDGFLGGTLSNGNAFGLHVYIAHQDGGYETESGSYQVDGNSYASIIRGDAGINWQLGSGTDFELTGGIARVQYGPDHKDFFEDGDFSYLGNARAFFALDAIDGELIPAVRLTMSRLRAWKTDTLRSASASMSRLTADSSGWAGISSGIRRRNMTGLMIIPRAKPFIILSMKTKSGTNARTSAEW